MMRLDCGGKLLDLSQPRVMGILNITPDSYCAIGRYTSVDAAVTYAQQMVAEGAAIIDVGGEPTNPGVNPVISLQQELDRVIPVIEALADNIDVPISVDTSKPQVMQEAIAHGARFINDVRGLSNPGALRVVAEANVAVCLMHMAFPLGNPDPAWHAGDDVAVTVKEFLQARIDACIAAGIARERIVIDPGIGGGSFGKNVAQNLQLLANLNILKTCHVPILVGVSRKMFIGELLDLPVEQRLSGSLAATVMAVNQGANIIRAHDVKATVEAVKVAAAIINNTHLRIHAAGAV